MFDLGAVLAIIAITADRGKVLVTKVKSTRELAQELGGGAKALRSRRRAHQDVLEAKKLLGIQQNDVTTYHNDNVHPLYDAPRSIHPDNLTALRAAAGQQFLDAVELGTLEVARAVPSTLDDNLVLIGSPTSEGISRTAFGYRSADGGDSLLLTGAPLDLPYRLILDRENVPAGATARRYVEGRGAVSRPNWRIESDSALHVPELGRDGWLETDYLLLTRVRNFLTETGLASNHSIVSVAGTHGVGTRGLDVLLRDKAVLRQVADATRGRDCPSFQALFRLSKIHHDDKGGSVARRIELVGDVALLDDRPERWRVALEAVRPDVLRWLARHQPPDGTDAGISST